MQDWMLVYNHFDPAEERLREALCTLGNGYFVTCGAAEETSADETHYPGTYLAGGYNRLKSEIAGRAIEKEDRVNLPTWLCLTFRAEDGDWFDLWAVETLSYR
jgi:trehalose/maltose hydrolase-like predicted phosphorylase